MNNIDWENAFPYPTQEFHNKLCQTLDGLEEKDEALNYRKKAKRPAWVKRGADAAGLCLAIAGGLLFNSRQSGDFNSLVNHGSVDTMSVMVSVTVDGRTAWYEQVNVSDGKLEKWVGNEYLDAGAMTWYYPLGADNLKYLIRQDADGTLSLWVFTSFAADDGETYTYGDVLSVIYGADSAEDIVSITTSPYQANNTAEGKAVQDEVGTHTYTDREAIATFYNIVKAVVCCGADGENPADNTRFSYSFSTESADKLTSGESTYGTRCISIEFTDGTTLDSWKYSALSGSFFEYGGIFTEPLADADVYALNSIFGIE